MGAYEDLKANGKVKGFQTPGENVAGVVNKLAPYATTYTTATNLNRASVQKLTDNSPSQNYVEQFGSFVGNIGKQVGGMAVDATKWLAQSAVDSLHNTATFVYDVATAQMDIADRTKANEDINRQITAIDDKRNALKTSYQSGRIPKDEYVKGMVELSKQSNELSIAATGEVKKIEDKVNEVKSTAVDAALTVATVVSSFTRAGMGAIAVTSNVAAETTAKTVAKEAAEATAKPIINFFGRKEVSTTLYKAATNIDSVTKTVIDTINKVGTFNGHLPTGQIFKLTSSTIAEGASSLTAKQIAKNVAINLILKKPLIYQTDIGLVTDIYTDIAKGDLQGAALSTIMSAGMALSGGPVGWAMNAVSKGATVVKNRMFATLDIQSILRNEAKTYSKGEIAKMTEDFIQDHAGQKVSTGSFIDQLSVRVGDGTDSQGVKVILEDFAKGNAKTAQYMKVMEDINVQMSHGDASLAVQNIVDYYEGIYGKGYLRSATMRDIVDDMVRHASVRDAIVKDAIVNGATAEEASRIVVGRATQKDLKTLSGFMQQADESVQSAIDVAYTDVERKALQINARKEFLETLIEKQGRLNACYSSKTFMKEITDIIEHERATPNMVKKINAITSGKLFEGKLSPSVIKDAAKDGYFAVLPKKTYTPYVSVEKAAESKMITRYSSEEANLFEKAVKPMPILSEIGVVLTNLGLSPVSAEASVYKMYKKEFTSLVDNLGVERIGGTKANGDVIMTKLNNFMRDYNASPGFTRKIVDPRQLTKKEIMSVLRCTEAEAKKVLGSLNTAMLNVPLAMRGLGDKIQDLNTALNPLASQYSRTQGAMRYTYNPFFRWQQTYQTETMVQLEAITNKLGFKPIQTTLMNRVNKVVFKEFDETNDVVVKMLQDRNIFASGYSGEASGTALGQIGTSIIKSEKKSLAGLVQLQAKNAGYTDIGLYIDKHLDETIDTMRALTVHSRTASFTDSPLARTINTAFFPFRFNMKTANLMAGYIGKLPATTQVAVLANYMKSKDWLDSSEGQAWQSQYSEAIKLFSWLSPTYPLSYVLKLGEDIVDPENSSVGDLGMLGGLPFGMISQILEANGIIQASAPYLNPKTGEVYPKYIPQTARAEVSLAIQSFIGSMFSYPGTIIGLPGKGQMIRSVVNSTVGGANEFKEVDQTYRLTPEQKRQQEVLSKQAGVKPTETTVVQANPTTTKIESARTIPDITVKPTTTAAKKKKKSEYRPRPI